MNYESRFLGNQGLTLAEANYTANIVKELCEKINNEINRMSLFSSKLLYQGTEKDFTKVNKVEELERKCMEEGNLYALSAWLREGIKAKNNLIESANFDSFDIELLPQPLMYKLISNLSEEDIKKELPINELTEYLTYEAKASHIGKKVHPNGIFDRWFKALKDTPPLQIHSENKDFIISLTEIVKEEDLYSIYFNLQKEYREAEQKVNYYKAKIKNILSEKTIEINNKNSEIRKTYQQECDKINSENYKLQKDIENKRLEKVKELSDLKIIIPNNLQKTMDFVQEYSKK